jgi:hypothetical protein
MSLPAKTCLTLESDEIELVPYIILIFGITMAV